MGLPRGGHADLVLTGGHVIDPASGRDAVADVAISAGRILRIGPALRDEAAQRVDVSGLIVTPGIIDIHTHVFTFSPTPDSYIEGVRADAHLLASGVTTTVDAGTAGWGNFGEFKRQCIDRATVRVLALVNIAAQGMVHAESEQTLGDLDPSEAAAVAAAFADLVVGIKSAHYWTTKPWDAAHPPWESVDRAVAAGEKCGKPVMVDFWPRPPERPYQDLVLTKLRPGDIHTHLFARQFPVVDASGKLQDHLWKARKRGVLFDLGHGAASFWYRNAVPAQEQSFPPDTISTDLHFANINGPVLSMQQTMSKYLAMGMPLVEVITRSTTAPARVIGRPDLGTLGEGAIADIAVFHLLKGDFSFADCGQARLNGTSRLECALTMRAGRIVFNPAGLGMPAWREAPPPYWEIPKLQG